MQPPAYTPTVKFSSEESNSVSGRSGVRTAALDAEHSNIAATLATTLANLSLIQRDDGKLRDLAVDTFNFSAAALSLIGSAGFNVRGLWLTGTAYAVKDMVRNTTGTYVCILAHTSGVFATDLAANKWATIFDSANYSASGISFTPVGTLASTDVQSAIAEMLSEALTPTFNSVHVLGAGDAMPYGGGALSLVGTGGSTYGMSITAQNPQYALFQTTSPGTTVNEASICMSAYDSASVLQKTSSVSSKWANANTNVGEGVLRLNATYQNGAGAYVDGIGLRVFGKSGVDVFGTSDTVGPGAYTMRVNGYTLTLAAGRSGGTLTGSVDNLSNTAGSHAWNWTRTAGASAGNPFYSSLIAGGNSWSWGLDHADSDKWKLSAFSVLGTNDRLVVTQAGNVSIPGTFAITTFGAFVAGDKYVIVDAGGNFHKSALGPAS